MKKLILMFIVTCAFTFSVKAQVNYVLNASFEAFSQCPHLPDQIRNAYNWSSIDTAIADPLCSPEYCNVCDTTHHFGVPVGTAYYHYPRSGSGMAQMLMYFDESFPDALKRDYLQGRFYKKLSQGTNYCVTFYTTLTQWSEYAVNHIGALLDDGSIDNTDSVDCASPQTGFTPQIIETSIVNDTLNWVKVQGSFVAAGNERFITIGNFYNKANTSFVALPYSTQVVGYYLVDDVSVIESNEKANAGLDGLVSPGSDSAFIGIPDEGMPVNWYIAGNPNPISHQGGFKVHPDTATTYVVELDLCGHVTTDTVTVFVAPAGISTVNENPEIRIYPNPVSNNLTVEHAANMELTLVDVWGRCVYRTFIASDKQMIGIEAVPKGVYIVQVSDETRGHKITEKLIKD